MPFAWARPLSWALALLRTAAARVGGLWRRRLQQCPQACHRHDEPPAYPQCRELASAGSLIGEVPRDTEDAGRLCHRDRGAASKIVEIELLWFSCVLQCWVLLTKSVIVKLMALRRYDDHTITHWPASLVQVPAVERTEVHGSEDGWLEIGRYDFPRAEQHLVTVELPDEWYLRELVDLDASDMDAVVAFTAQWGLLSEPGQAMLPHVDRAREQRQPPDRFIPTVEKVHIDEIAEMRRRIIDITKTWASYSGEAEVRGADVLDLQRCLNDGLAVFQANVDFFAHQEDSPMPTPRTPSAYQAACLQLFNHIAEGARLKRCENGPCGRLFYRQRSQSEHSQQRMESKYCTPECGQAERQRRYRRNKTAEKS